MQCYIMRNKIYLFIILLKDNSFRSNKSMFLFLFFLNLYKKEKDEDILILQKKVNNSNKLKKY